MTLAGSWPSGGSVPAAGTGGTGGTGLDWRYWRYLHYRRRSRESALADVQAELAVVGEDQVLGEGRVRGIR